MAYVWEVQLGSYVAVHVVMPDVATADETERVARIALADKLDGLSDEDGGDSIAARQPLRMMQRHHHVALDPRITDTTT